MLPIEEASSLPSHCYTSPDSYKTDKNVFLWEWVCVGSTKQLEKNNYNNYFAVDLVDEPIIIAKDRENIHAISGVCRHKAACLKNPGETGVASKFICPYHGWTYKLNGDLLGCTEFEDAKNFHKEENGLPKFDVGIHESLIFVNKSKSLPFYKYAKCLENIKMPDMEHHSSKIYDMNCNWKVFVDNYLDGGYHISYAHKKLASAINYSQYKTEVFDKVVVQSTPLSNNELRQGTAYYIWVWPNLMINISDGVMDTNLVFPTGPETCRVIFDFYFAKDYDSGLAIDSIYLSDVVQKEDIGVCESAQKGMRSQYFRHGRYNPKREIGIYYFHSLLRNKY